MYFNLKKKIVSVTLVVCEKIRKKTMALRKEKTIYFPPSAHRSVNDCTLLFLPPW